MLKSKISVSTLCIFSLKFNLNADFQKFNAEIPFTPSFLDLCIQRGTKADSWNFKNKHGKD